MRKQSLLNTTVPIGIAAIALGAWRFHSDSSHMQGPPAPAPVPVVVGTALSHDVPIYLRGVGTVVAYNNVLVRSQITGQIVKIAFTQGRAVRKGDLLAEIDPRPYQAQLDQAVANRDRDQAQLVNAQANLNRYVPLAAKGYATTQLVDTQRAQLAQLQAMVKSDEAIIEAAKTNLISAIPG
jgi:multidrug efflux system membrane fusion protein